MFCFSFISEYAIGFSLTYWCRDFAAIKGLLLLPRICLVQYFELTVRVGTVISSLRAFRTPLAHGWNPVSSK